jgi:hypothetical protein
MINDGQTIQLSQNAFMGTPTAIDGETAWKLCSKGDPGAIRLPDLDGGDLYVNMDRDKSIENNKAAMKSEYRSAFAKSIDALDIVRHQTAKLFGR